MKAGPSKIAEFGGSWAERELRGTITVESGVLGLGSGGLYPRLIWIVDYSGPRGAARPRVSISNP